MLVATFGDRLQYVLKQKNMSQTDLAKLTGLTRATINQYIKGVVNPRPDKVELIANVLNVDMSFLLGLNVDMNGNVLDKFNDVRKNNQEIDFINKAVGQALEMLRDKKRKTINEIAEMLDRKPSTIIKFENGEELIPIVTVMRMCYLLEYDISEFYQDVLYFYKTFHKNKKD